MKTWDDFLPACAPFLPGCPSFEVKDKLRLAAIEFLERSRWWRAEQVPLVTTEAGVRDYFITDLPEDAGLTHIQAAWVGQRHVGVAAPGETLLSYPSEQQDRWKVALIGQAQIRLSVAPIVGGEVLTATVAYIPTETAEGVPPTVYYRWHEAIEKRAIGELMMQAGKAWSSAMAPTHLNRFEKLQREAAEEAGPVGRQRRPFVQQWG